MNLKCYCDRCDTNSEIFDDDIIDVVVMGIKNGKILVHVNISCPECNYPTEHSIGLESFEVLSQLKWIEQQTTNLKVGSSSLSESTMW